MKILAPTDGSASAESALCALAGTRWRAGTQIMLLSVKDVHSKSNSGSADPSLDRWVDRLQQTFPECKITADMQYGDPKAHIVDTARQWSADLIVMGTRGNKGHAPVIGSVSQGVLLQAHCPVIVVKTVEDHGLERGFKSIVLSVDNSAYARAALTWVMGIDWGDATTFRLVTVVPPLIEFFSGEMNPLLVTGLAEEHALLTEKAKVQLAEMAQSLASVTSADRVSTVVVDGDPREGILNVAAASNADLIVMGSHGKTGLTRLLLGSVSQAISQHAPCSVAIVKGLVPKGQANPLQRTGRFS